jgi:hypothetical protein
VGDALLEQLTYYAPEHPPCYPNLRAIELRDICATDGIFSGLVESRCSTNSKKRFPSSQPAPAQLNRVLFAFIDLEGELTGMVDHPEDSIRLREMGMADDPEMELEIVWVAPDWTFI